MHEKITKKYIGRLNMVATILNNSGGHGNVVTRSPAFYGEDNF